MKIQSKVQAQINVSKLNISVFQSQKLKRKHRILTHRKHVKILIYGQKLSNLIYTFLQMLYALCFQFNRLWPDFQYGFRSSRSTPDLLIVLSDRIARSFNRSGATRAVALDISKPFDKDWHAGLLHKLWSYEISGQIFGLISSFFSNRQLRVVLEGKTSQEYPVNTGNPQGSILGPTLFLLYNNELTDDVICNIAIYPDDTTFNSKFDLASDLWH